MIRRIALVVCSVIVAGCERAKSAAPAKPASSNAVFASSPAPVTAKPWENELGAVVGTPSPDGGAPVFFVRDTTGAADLEVELFSHDDRTTRATVHPEDATRTCAWRRHASLTTTDGRAAPNGWSLALAPGIASPFGIDGMGELLPRDSATLVARISRLVSAIPEDSLSAPFRGLPVVVRDAWRFQLADSTAVVVAIAMRSLNVESNPRAQSITLIAEPDASSAGNTWRTAFTEHESGPEDRVEGADLLAAFQLNGARAAVALLREGDTGLQLEIVERTAPGIWKMRWSSATLPCTQP